MIRTKVTLVFFVIVLLLGALTVGLIHLDMGETTRETVRNGLRRSANVAEQSIRLDEASLLAKAEFIGGAEALHSAMIGDEPAAEEGAEGQAEGLSFVERRHLAAREKLDVQRYRLDDIAKAVAGQRNLALAPLERKPNDFDLFATLDVKGQGVAALGKDLYSWFGDDIAKTHPGVREVAKTGVARVEYWMWSFSPTQEKRPYRVAIAPIRRSETDSTAGVVILGTMINDGIAATKQQLAAGLNEDASATALETTPQILMYRGKNVIGSTFDSAQQKAVSLELDRVGGFTADSSAILDVSVNDAPYFAMVRPISGEGEAAVGVAVLANTHAALAPLQQLTTSLILVFLLFGVLGGGLLFVLILRWVQPVEQVEAGIHEMLAGNRDYVWTPLPNHTIQTSLAQSLNLMSAYLQGRASPDDDSSSGSWGLEMDDMSEVQQGPTKIQGVALPMMQAAPPKKDE